jgi:uncharacterized protein involved in response to NO
VLFYLGAGIPYPNVAHARLMIEGFMASFIFGFLGTAGPRITSAPHFSLSEVTTIFTLDLLAAGAHSGSAHRLGDIVTRLPFRGRTFLADCLRVGIMSILAGFIVVALFPIYRVGALHIVFITGFNFIAFTVAIRVVFGHSGNAHLFRKRLPFFLAVSFLISFAMFSRYVADLTPKARTIHLIAAAAFWLIAALIWMVKVIPNVAITELE